jgi:hypothetical protein
MPTIEETREQLRQWKWQQGWGEVLICPRCSSSNLTGQGQGEPDLLPDPEHEGEVLEGWQVVHFTCTACLHQWTEGEQSEAERLQEAGMPGLFETS